MMIQPTKDENKEPAKEEFMGPHAPPLDEDEDDELEGP